VTVVDGQRPPDRRGGAIRAATAGEDSALSKRRPQDSKRPSTTAEAASSVLALRVVAGVPRDGQV